MISHVWAQTFGTLVRVKFVPSLILRAAMAALCLTSSGFASITLAQQAASAKPNVTRSQNTSRLAVRQLIWPLESVNAFVNGSPIQLAAPSRTIAGRTMLPLRELARALGVTLEAVPNVPDGLRLGRLEVYPNLKLARLDGRQVPLQEVATTVDGTLYVAVRALEVGLGATVVFDSVQRTVTITVSRDRPDGPRLPVARFSTDKREYKLGEPVRVTEYSYDPDGVPIVGLNYVGREEAYFTPGLKSISLVATNRVGRNSEPYTVQIRVTNEVMYSLRDYGLRYTPPGRTFTDFATLTYPNLPLEREDGGGLLLVSDSPEEPETSGLVFQDVINGPARFLAYHINAAREPGRLLVMASNLEPDPVAVNMQRFGETAATNIVATLGQTSLLDFLTSQGKDSVRLEPGASMPLYLSPSFAPGQGLNLMFDLETNGQVFLEVFFLEEPTRRSLGDLNTLPAQDALRSLPVLESDSNHVRGSFPATVRELRLDLGTLANGAAGRLVIGDGLTDPAITGYDALSDRPVTLLGNYGMTYRIILENAAGTVAAFVPRGGPYSGAIRVNGTYMSLPDSGVLVRNDLPAVIYRALEPNANPRIELEFVPASGSYLPVQLVFYRLEAKPNTPEARLPSPRVQPPR